MPRSGIAWCLNKGRGKAGCVCTVLFLVHWKWIFFEDNQTAFSYTVATIALMTVQFKGPWKEYQTNRAVYWLTAVHSCKIAVNADYICNLPCMTVLK